MCFEQVKLAIDRRTPTAQHVGLDGVFMPPVIRLSVLLMMVGCYQSASVLTSDDILSIRVDNPEDHREW